MTVLVNGQGGELTQESFTPTVSLQGGAGNIVPAYSVNSGYLQRLDSLGDFTINLSGDGGVEGDGTGQIAILLPYPVLRADSYVIGESHNGGIERLIRGVFNSNSQTLLLQVHKTGFSDSLETGFESFKGNMQNASDRKISLHFTAELA